MQYIFNSEGVCLERNNNPIPPSVDTLIEKYGAIEVVESNEFDTIPIQYLTLNSGAIVVSEDYVAPVENIVNFAELKSEVESLKQVIDYNVPASAHDRRFLKQKESAKELIYWIRDNSSATEEQVVTQIFDKLATDYPGEPIILSPLGLIQSYAYEAVIRGYIANATFDDLKQLIINSTDEQLRLMLRVI